MIHGLFGFLTGLILYAYLSRRMNAVYGLLGFLLFISVPAIARLSHWAYIDLGVTFFSTACLTALVRWRENKAETRWLVLAALAAGFAAATKPNGLVVGLMATFILAFVLAEQRERAVAKTAAPLLIFAVVGALPVMPWLVKNWLQTGNPLFPFLTGLCPAGAGGPGVATEGFAGLGILAKRGLLYGESWWQIAALPLRLFFTGRDDDPQHFDGVLSPVLILLLPWAFKGKWLAEKKIFLSFAALYLVYALFLVDLRVRYILPIVPPLVILAVYGVFNIYAGIRRPAFLFAGLLLIAVLHGSYLWRTYQEVAPLGFLAGRERREDYLTRVLPGYTVFRYANRELPPAAKIYLLFMGRRAYYLERGYFHDGGELPAALLGAIRSARDPAQIEKALEERGITHLMVREDLLRRFLADNLRPAEREVWDAFVGRHLRAQFRDYGYGVYQLHG
jgi:4-amino-4-deoxy-L-arabinose transferase-like glycosyltransferase